VVEQFVADFRFRGVTMSDLKSLGDSDERVSANATIHIQYPNESGTLRTAWKYLKPVLNDVEVTKYERLVKFALGECIVVYIVGVLWRYLQWR
jgi:hypothetical protein